MQILYGSSASHEEVLRLTSEKTILGANFMT